MGWLRRRKLRRALGERLDEVEVRRRPGPALVTRRTIVIDREVARLRVQAYERDRGGDYRLPD